MALSPGCCLFNTRSYSLEMSAFFTLVPSFTLEKKTIPWACLSLHLETRSLTSPLSSSYSDELSQLDTFPASRKTDSISSYPLKQFYKLKKIIKWYSYNYLTVIRRSSSWSCSKKLSKLFLVTSRISFWSFAKGVFWTLVKYKNWVFMRIAYPNSFGRIFSNASMSSSSNLHDNKNIGKKFVKTRNTLNVFRMIGSQSCSLIQK